MRLMFAKTLLGLVGTSGLGFEEDGLVIFCGSEVLAVGPIHHLSKAWRGHESDGESFMTLCHRRCWDFMAVNQVWRCYYDMATRWEKCGISSLCVSDSDYKVYTTGQEYVKK